jgi:hypothetical protein
LSFLSRQQSRGRAKWIVFDTYVRIEHHSGQALVFERGPIETRLGDDTGMGKSTRSEVGNSCQRSAASPLRRGLCDQALEESADLRSGNKSRLIANAAMAPANCASIKTGTSIGRIPENVLVSDLAIVIAGFAKEVEAVNQ